MATVTSGSTTGSRREYPRIGGELKDSGLPWAKKLQERRASHEHKISEICSSNLDIDSEPDSELLDATPLPAPVTAPAENGPAVEPAAVDDDQGGDAQQIEVDAEMVEPGDDQPEVIMPTPGGFTSVRRVPAAQVGGRGVNPYDPLGSWRPGQTRHRR
jgi:hypothetical protein